MAAAELKPPVAPVVAVTRPAPDGAELLRCLHQRGYPALHTPAFRLEPAAEPERTAAELRAALPADLVLFTSPAAVEYALALTGPALFGPAQLLAPGQGTAKALAEHDLEAEWPKAGGTSEAILAMPALARPEGKRVVVLAAPGGRRLIDRTLHGRGARVERVEVYRRRSMPPSESFRGLLRERGALITLISSAGALEHLHAELPAAERKHWLAQPMVVSSGRLAGLCAEMGAAATVTAAGADHESMLAALDSLKPRIPGES